MRCITCPANSTCTSTNFECAVGFETSADSRSCLQCPHGKFRSVVHEKCVDCPLNSLCNSTSFVCISGYQLTSSREGCTKILTGDQGNTLIGDQMNKTPKNESCPVGYYLSNSVGTCVMCPAGYERKVIDTECIRCLKGYFKKPGSVSCQSCPQNSASCSESDFTCRQGWTKDTTSMTCESQEQYSVNESTFPVKEIIFIIVGATLLVVLMIIYFAQKTRQERTEFGFETPKNDRSTDALNQNQSTISLDTTVLKTTILATQTTTKTFGTTSTKAGALADQGLYIPGFLFVQEGVDFTHGRNLARGGTGYVNLGTAVSSQLTKYGEPVIIKELYKMRNEADKDSFHQEVAIMYMCRDHLNIAKILGYSEDPHCIIIKYYENASLEHWIISPVKIKTKDILVRFASDVSNGLRFMHEHGLAHCDMKPSNILLDIDEQGFPFCVLSDFGLARPVGREALKVLQFKATEINGASVAYASPETLKRFRFGGIFDVTFNSQRADVYSVGVIVFRLACRIIPWIAETSK